MCVLFCALICLFVILVFICFSISPLYYVRVNVSFFYFMFVVLASSAAPLPSHPPVCSVRPSCTAHVPRAGHPSSPTSTFQTRGRTRPGGSTSSITTRYIPAHSSRVEYKQYSIAGALRLTAVVVLLLLLAVFVGVVVAVVLRTAVDS